MGCCSSCCSGRECTPQETVPSASPHDACSLLRRNPPCFSNLTVACALLVSSSISVRILFPSEVSHRVQADSRFAHLKTCMHALRVTCNAQRRKGDPLQYFSCVQVDRELDAETPNAGSHRFEKMVSGMYLGEVARRVILKLAVSNLLPCHLSCNS